MARYRENVTMKKKQLIRANFRDAVFKRDNYTCAMVGCQIKTNLDAHHIIDRNLLPNGGYVKENGISLCPDHHMMAELFHISNGVQWNPGMHPDDLFKIIKSNYELAKKASEKLN